MDDIQLPFENETPPEVRVKLNRLLRRSDISALRRPAWRPITTHGDDIPTASKYGGLPWLQEGEVWPCCNVCQRPRYVFLQLNLQELPAELGKPSGNGLIQFFYCKRSDCPMRGKLPPDRVSLVRMVDITLPSKAVVRSEEPTDLFTVLQITDWKQQVDFPDPQKAKELGIELNDDYQFEPQVTLNYSFGQEFFDRPVDTGCGWLFQCSQHKDQLAFTWQCH